MTNAELARPVEAADDWTIPQGWSAYTPVNHATWAILLERQVRLLPGRMAPEFLDGLDILRLFRPGIPDFEELSSRLMKATGWQVVAVPGLVPDDVFFDHLANRRFVSGNFIRPADQLDYLQKPDVFHDVFGHVPLLANSVFADYMEAYGKGGQRAAQAGAIDSFDDLLEQTLNTDFGPVYTELDSQPDIEIDTVPPSDRVCTRGTQAMHAPKRRYDHDFAGLREDTIPIFADALTPHLPDRAPA